MEHFYVTLPSDSSGYYFPNTIANFKTKLDTPIELKPDEWDVGLVKISYRKGCKKFSYLIHFGYIHRKLAFL